MDRGAWWVIVRGVAKNQTRLSTEHSTHTAPWWLSAGHLVRSLGQEELLEKGMATHCSILAWEIPWTEEPAGLQSMGSQRVG